MPLVMTALLAVLNAGSQWVSNPEDLGKRFARVQGLLATADGSGAQHSYEALLAVPDHPLLRLSPVKGNKECSPQTNRSAVAPSMLPGSTVPKRSIPG